MMNDHPAQDAFQHAELDWDENGLPQSRHYGDVYLAPAGWPRPSTYSLGAERSALPLRRHAARRVSGHR